MKENSTAPTPTTISSKNLLSLVIEGCTNAKAVDLTALSVKDLSDIADYFVIACGRSDRQTQGIANRVIEILGEHGVKPVAIEGFDAGHWILLDFGDIVVHVFYEPVRAHYNLEALWSRAPRVNLKKKTPKRKSAQLHAA